MRNLFAKFKHRRTPNSLTRRAVMACPLAFAEVGVKRRVETVLKYKKPAFWLIIVGLIACAAVSVFFLTSPKDESETDVKYYAIGQNNKILYDEFESVYRAESVNKRTSTGYCH